ncbi:MAG: septum formation family protein [Propionicimonas sp.]|nr:septum formation family protein [Propionicimonas sp.]
MPRPARLAAALAAAVLIPVLTGCGVLSSLTGDAPRDDSGQVTSTADADAFKLRVGDCISDMESLSGEFESAPVAPCDTPHQGEIYAEQKLTDPDLSRPAGVPERADDFCGDSLNDFLGGEPTAEHETLELASLFPTDESWVLGDRTIQCVVYDPAGGLTGSLRDSAA